MKLLKNFFSLLKKKLHSKKISYSFGGCDLLIEYIFRNQANGLYVDIGCQNPISNNNTYLLHRRGWRGINIDLDQKNIDLFNLTRSKDINLCIALSSSKDDDFPTVKKIKTDTLNNVLEKKNITLIDYLNIDVEGYELEVLKGFDIEKYKPKVVTIEYLDLSLKKIEFKNNNINNVLNSEIYKFFISKNYFFVGWSHSDLLFVHKDFRD